MKALGRSFVLRGLLTSLALNAALVFSADKDNSYRKRNPVCPAFTRIAEWNNYLRYLRPVAQEGEEVFMIGLLVTSKRGVQRLYTGSYLTSNHQKLFNQALLDLGPGISVNWGGEMGFVTAAGKGISLIRANDISGFVFEEVKGGRRNFTNDLAALEEYFKKKGVPWDTTQAKSVPFVKNPSHLITFQDGSSWDPRHNPNLTAFSHKTIQWADGRFKITPEEVEKLIVDVKAYHVFETIDLIERHLPGAAYPEFYGDINVMKSFKAYLDKKDMEYLQRQSVWETLNRATLRLKSYLRVVPNDQIMHF